MKLKQIFLFPFLLCSVCLLASTVSAADSIEWIKSFDKAKEAAKQSNKPILIDFTADWCKPCKEMEKSFWTKPQVIELSQKFVCAKINFDKETRLAYDFGFQSIPVVILADSWGNMLKFQRGYGGGADAKLIQLLTAFPSDFSEVAKGRKTLESNPEDLQALMRLSDFYIAHSSFVQSNQFLKRALKTKAIEKDKAAKEDISISLGLNLIKLGEYDEARKIFEQCLIEFKGGKQEDLILNGLIMAQAMRGKFDEAEKLLAQLKERFPNSQLIKNAERNIQIAKQRK